MAITESLRILFKAMEIHIKQVESKVHNKPRIFKESAIAQAVV